MQQLATALTHHSTAIKSVCRHAVVRRHGGQIHMSRSLKTQHGKSQQLQCIMIFTRASVAFNRQLRIAAIVSDSAMVALYERRQLKSHLRRLQLP